jgi:hypothetical protein
MGNGYRVPPDGPLDELSQIVRRQNARISEVERPSGSQVFEALAKVKQLIADLPGLVAAAATAFLAGGFTTGSMNATGNVTASGTGTFTAGLNSPDVYSRVVTGTGSYHATYADSLGQLGQVPSSRRFKQDISTAMLDRATLRQMRVVFYRYIAAVEFLGDDAPSDLGVIAEEIHDLGLTFLVDYDDEGKPFGIDDRAMTFVAVKLAQDAHERLDEIERKLTRGMVL